MIKAQRNTKILSEFITFSLEKWRIRTGKWRIRSKNRRIRIIKRRIRTKRRRSRLTK